jgi:hypothetical protein
MTTLLTSPAKGRQQQAVTLERSLRVAGWQAVLGSKTSTPCHAFIGSNIANGLDSQYVPAGGSS